MPVIVSLDLGTSKLCGLAMDLDGLTPVAIRSKVNDAGVPGLPAGHDEQDPARILDLTMELLHELIDDKAVRGAEVRGVGISGQMHGVLLVDRNLRPATNLITWRDRRALRSDQPGNLAELSSKFGPAEAARTGCRLHAGYGGVTLFHRMRNGGLPGDCTAVTIADFIAGSLCGQIATEPTHAASWGLLNLRLGQWDQEMICRLGLPREILPEIRPAAHPLATLRPEHARSLGLPTDTQVCSPVGDNQASILGVAGLARDAAVVNLGTGGQVSVPQSEAVWVEGFETRPMPFGGHVSVGASLCGGWSYAYLRRFFQDVVRQFADVELSDRQVYERMNRLAAEAAPEAEGLTADTRFAGARDDPDLRGAVHCVDSHNLTAGNLARAFVEGMVRELADMFHRMTPTNVHQIIASGQRRAGEPAGGGRDRVALWTQVPHEPPCGGSRDGGRVRRRIRLGPHHSVGHFTSRHQGRSPFPTPRTTSTPIMKSNFYLFGCVLVAALGGLLFGFDTIVIQGTTDRLREVFGLSDFWLGFTVASALIGTVVGSLVAGKPSDRYGRRAVLFAVALIYFFSALGCALPLNWHWLLFFRFVGGLGVGGGVRCIASVHCRDLACPDARAAWSRCSSSMSSWACCWPQSRTT